MLSQRSATKFNAMCCIFFLQLLHHKKWYGCIHSSCKTRWTVERDTFEAIWHEYLCPGFFFNHLRDFFFYSNLTYVSSSILPMNNRTTRFSQSNLCSSKYVCVRMTSMGLTFCISYSSNSSPIFTLAQNQQHVAIFSICVSHRDTLLFCVIRKHVKQMHRKTYVSILFFICFVICLIKLFQYFLHNIRYNK